MADFEANNDFSQKQDENPSESENKENVENALTPTELLTEFLACIMMKDYEKAFNYCNQILVHEPNNSTAKEFYPLILQKLEMKFEDSTSESSDTGSTTSSGSFENSLKNNLGRKTSQETANNDFDIQDQNVLDSFNDFIALNTSKPGTEIACKTKEIIISSNISSKPTPKNPKEPKNESKLKKPCDERQLSLKRTKTKICLKSDDSIKSKEKKITKIKQERQKAQAAANISQNKTSSKTLLQPSKTITFPKELPPQI